MAESGRFKHQRISRLEDAGENFEQLEGEVFPKRMLKASTEGCLGDGTTDDTVAITKALQRLHSYGGGTFYLDPCSGGYAVNLTGNILVYDNTRIMGSDYAGRIKRIGSFPFGVGGRGIFRNADIGATSTDGNDNLSFREIYIHGGDPSQIAVPQSTMTTAGPITLSGVGQTITLADASRFPVPGAGGAAATLQLRMVDNVGAYHTNTYTGVSGNNLTGVKGAGTYSAGIDVQLSGINIAATAIKLQTSYDSLHPEYLNYCTQVRVQDCTVIEWPGPCIIPQRVKVGHFDGNTIDGNDRGGIIGFLDIAFLTINNNVITNNNDDCIATQAKAGSTVLAAYDIEIAGNTLSHADELGQATNNCISINGTKDSEIVGNTTKDSYATLKAGIELADADVGGVNLPNMNLLIADNRVCFTDASTARGYGIAYAGGNGSAHIKIKNNFVEGSGLEGIVVLPTADNGTNFVRIEGNDVVNCGQNGGSLNKDGISIQPSVANVDIKGLYVNRNHVFSPGRVGIGTDVSNKGGFTATFAEFNGNHVYNPNTGATTPTLVDGMYLEGLKRFQCFDNHIVMDPPAPGAASNCRYGLNITANCDRGHFSRTDSYTADFRTAAYNNAGTNMTDDANHKVA